MLRHFRQPITALLVDPAITEILVIGPERIDCLDSLTTLQFERGSGVHQSG